jgi:RNA-binding protein
MTEDTAPPTSPSDDSAAPPAQDALATAAEGMGSGQAVAAASPGFTGKQRRHLRALAHKLKPIVMVGQHGLSERLVGAVEAALEQHELIKLKVLEGAPCSREHAALWLHATTGASVVQIVGRTLVVYRPHPEKPVIVLPSK